MILAAIIGHGPDGPPIIHAGKISSILSAQQGKTAIKGDPIIVPVPKPTRPFTLKELFGFYAHTAWVSPLERGSFEDREFFPRETRSRLPGIMRSRHVLLLAVLLVAIASTGLYALIRRTATVHSIRRMQVRKYQSANKKLRRNDADDLPRL